MMARLGLVLLIVDTVVVMLVLLVAGVVDVVVEVVAVVVIVGNVLAVGIHVVRVRQRLGKLPIGRRSRARAPRGKRCHPVQASA
jgi:phosphatidylglycerophosphate synthase